jgi:CheY-like chemotaxis protein
MEPAKTYGPGEKVLLAVEDDPSAFVLLQFGFAEVGGDFRLYWLQDGAEALRFLRRAGQYANAPRPDLILLNLNLPRVTGLGVLRAMRDDPALGDIPAVVFSSSHLDRDRMACLALGAREFITKPTDLDEFLGALRDVCRIVPSASNG